MEKKILWLFTTIEEAKKFVEWKDIVVWDRIIILWNSQTTFEWIWSERRNINGIYLKWEKGQDWLDWKDGKHGKDIDHVFSINKLYEMIKIDESFQKKIKGEKWDSIKWEKWEPWKDFNIGLSEIIDILVKKLLEDEYFVDKCKWEPWKDWYSPIKWKDYFDGIDWTWKDGEDGMDWADWWRVVFIEDTENISIKPNELWINISKNLYIYRNNSVLKL
jgi:hypothetical protein